MILSIAGMILNQYLAGTRWGIGLPLEILNMELSSPQWEICGEGKSAWIYMNNGWILLWKESFLKVKVGKNQRS